MTRAELRDGVLVVARGLVDVSTMPEFQSALAEAISALVETSIGAFPDSSAYEVRR